MIKQEYVKFTQDFLNQLKQETSGIWFMDGREKGEWDSYIGQEVEIEDYAPLDGDNGVYYAVALKGHDEEFFLSGGALTKVLQNHGADGFMKGFRFRVCEKVNTSNARTYRPIGME